MIIAYKLKMSCGMIPDSWFEAAQFQQEYYLQDYSSSLLALVALKYFLLTLVSDLS